MRSPHALHHVRQVQEGQTRRLQESQAVRAASLLPIDLANVVVGIEEGRLNDVDAINEEIGSVSRAAADRLAEAQGTGNDIPLCYASMFLLFYSCVGGVTSQACSC